MNSLIHHYKMWLAPVAINAMVAPAPSVAVNPDIKTFNTPDEIEAIQALLNNYTQSVMSCDAAKFEALLLDKNIPFIGTAKIEAPSFVASSQSIAGYGGFKAVIFESGRSFNQTFHDVQIQQYSNLAQVSLRYITTDTATEKGSEGWKVLHLLKVKASWKIVSEFYCSL